MVMLKYIQEHTLPVIPAHGYTPILNLTSRPIKRLPELWPKILVAYKETI